MSRRKITKYLLIIGAALFVAGFLIVPKAHAATLTPVYQILTPQGGSQFTGVGQVIANIWNYIMAAVNTLVLAMLIFVAFMNILRIQIDSYAVKKFLPTFIMSVILANFSFLICRVVIDFGNVAISLFLVGSQAGQVINPAASTNTISGAFDELLKMPPPAPGSAANYYGTVGYYIFQQLIILVGSGFVFVLSFIFLIRNYFIYVLVAVSPAAFMAMTLPMTKKYFQMWWSNFFKWVFMPVIAVFWLWIAGLFISEISKLAGQGGWLLTSAFAIFCFYEAITSPFKLGGAAMGVWAKAGNWGRKQGQEAWNKGTSDVARFSQRQAANAPTGSRAKKFWTGTANVSAGANPNTWRRAYKAGQENLGKKRDKALLRSDVYGRVAGPEAQLDALITKEREDREYYTPGQLVNELTDTRERNFDQIITNDNWKRMKDNDLKTKYQAFLTATPGANLPQQREAMTSLLLGKNTEDLRLGVLGTSGIDAFKSPQDLAKLMGSLQKARQMKGRRDSRGILGGTDTAGNVGFFPSATIGSTSPAPAPGGPPPPNPPSPPELTEIEDILHDIHETLVDQGHKEGGDVDRTMADVVKPTNIGVGIAHIPELEVRIKGIDPAAAEQLRALQARVAKTTNAQALHLAQKEESALQAVATQLKSGKSPDQIIGSADEAQSMLDRGDIAGAQQIVQQQIAPSAGPSLELMNSKSSHE